MYETITDLVVWTVSYKLLLLKTLRCKQ